MSESLKVAAALSFVLLLAGIVGIVVLDHILIVKSEEKLVALYGEESRKFVPQYSFHARSSPASFPENYFLSKLQPGISTKSDVESVVLGYTTKTEDRTFPESGVWSQTYFFQRGIVGGQSLSFVYHMNDVLSYIAPD